MVFIVVSPAKTMQKDNPTSLVSKLSQPLFLEEAGILLKHLISYTPQEISSLMNLSDQLAWLNVQRYRDIVHQKAKIFSAIELFAGEMYRSIDYISLKLQEKMYLQNNLFILSGLYGILRPNDAISPYRLERWEQK